MNLLFPDRRRSELKNKFKKEEKLHPELVYKYIDKHTPLDTDTVHTNMVTANAPPPPPPPPPTADMGTVAEVAEVAEV